MATDRPKIEKGPVELAKGAFRKNFSGKVDGRPIDPKVTRGRASSEKSCQDTCGIYIDDRSPNTKAETAERRRRVVADVRQCQQLL
jgi:hypothetical protein